MDEDKGSANIESAINERKAEALSLGLEEKAELITSELGKKTVSEYYSPYDEWTGGCHVTTNKAMYIGKAVPCSDYALEIIVCISDYHDKSGSKEVTIFTRKQLIFPFLYKSKLVYASEASLREPEKIKVTHFRGEDKWLDDLELICSRVKADHELRKALGALDKLNEKLKNQDDLKERYGIKAC